MRFGSAPDTNYLQENKKYLIAKAADIADPPLEPPVRRPAYVYEAPVRTYVYDETVPVPTYVYPRYPRYYRGHRPYRYYAPGVGVAVGPRGVGVRAGGISVGVSPGDDFRVRVGRQECSREGDSLVTIIPAEAAIQKCPGECRKPVWTPFFNGVTKDKEFYSRTLLSEILIRCGEASCAPYTRERTVLIIAK